MITNGTGGARGANEMERVTEAEPIASGVRGPSPTHFEDPGHADLDDGSDGRDARRAELRRQTDCEFLDAESYRALLVSARRLRRRDDGRAKLRGLLDLVTGTWFVIEEENVFQRGVS